MSIKGSVDWGELAVTLFESGGRKTYHVDEVAKIGVDLGLVPVGESSDSFAKKLNGFLARNVKNKAAQFSKVPNKKGGYKKGIYRLKPMKSRKMTAVAPKVETAFTGAAGEFAVLSELLFWGFNASKMTVDDGIDVVASKKGKYFHIQVKTANGALDKPYQASVRSKSFQHSTNVFYVIVLRTYSSKRYINDFVIFSSGEIHQLIAKGVLKNSATISLRIRLEKGRYWLGKNYDVTHNVNNWDCLC